MDSYPRPVTEPAKRRSGWLTGVLVIMFLADSRVLWSGVQATLAAFHGRQSPLDWFAMLYYGCACLDLVAAMGIVLWKRWAVVVLFGTSLAACIANFIKGYGPYISLSCFFTFLLVSAALAIGGDNCGWRRLE